MKYEIIIEELFNKYSDSLLNLNETKNPHKVSVIKHVLDNTRIWNEKNKLYEESRVDILYRLVFHIMCKLLAFDIVGVYPVTDFAKTIEISLYKKLPIVLENILFRTIHTYECMQDGKKDDIEEELIQYYSSEFSFEINCELSRLLRKTSKNEIKYTYNNSYPLYTLINYQANIIDKQTKAGTGNWCILSTFALDILLKDSSLRRLFSKNGNAWYFGLLNTIHVYVDPYAAEHDPIVVGYHRDQAITSLFYAIHMPIIPQRVEFHPATLEPYMRFTTSHGYFTGSDDHKSSDYLASITIETQPVFQTGTIHPTSF